MNVVGQDKFGATFIGFGCHLVLQISYRLVLRCKSTRLIRLGLPARIAPRISPSPSPSNYINVHVHVRHDRAHAHDDVRVRVHGHVQSL